MKTIQETRLAQFVNRISEFESFSRLLENKQKRIMTVRGDSGVGKTSLLARMRQECARRNIKSVELVWTDIRNHDYLAIMRRIRDEVGSKYFESFTNVVNYLTDPFCDLKITFQGSSSLATHSQFTNSVVRDMAQVIIKDSMLVVPRTDLSVTANERMIRLTDQFIADLATAVENIPVVVFFDAVEKMTVETNAWVWGELLQSVADGRLSNIWFVLCGCRDLQYNPEMKSLIEETKLQPLQRSDIVEYLEKRGIHDNRRADIADTLFISTNGNPRQVAIYVDALFLLWNKARH
jgi:archaellum biogenesis ATPase FlaH